MPLTGAAAARLFDDHVDAVHALVARRVGPDLAPQVTGEVFEQAIRSWDRFDPVRGTERLFLYGIATFVLRRHPGEEATYLASLSGSLPSRIADPLVDRDEGSDRTDPGGEPDDEAGDGDTTAGTGGRPADDDVNRVMRAVTTLAPDDRDILLLTAWEGCQHGDVAEALDLTPSTVRSSLNRIRRELKKAVGAGAGPA